MTRSPSRHKIVGMFHVTCNYEIHEFTVHPQSSAEYACILGSDNIWRNNGDCRESREAAEALRDMCIENELADLRDQAKRINLRLRFLNQVKQRINGA